MVKKVNAIDKVDLLKKADYDPRIDKNKGEKYLILLT